MKRSIYCSLSELQDLYEYNNTCNPADWRPMILRNLDSVYALSDEKTSPSDESTFISFADGSTSQVGNPIAKISYLNEWLGERLTIVTGIEEIFPQRFLNGALCKSVAPDLNALGRLGIEAIDDIDDKWVKSLREHWYEDTVQNKGFTWEAFFGNSLPASNSAVVVDRYLFFKMRNGAFNVGSILNSIIPDDYDQQYNVTIVFELNSLEWRQEEKKKDKRKLLPNKLVKKDIEDINLIGKIICQAVHHNKQVCLDFIAVLDPKEKEDKMGRDASYFKWANLHNATHDRRIITNNYLVMATQAISSSCNKGGKILATYSQRIMFESLLSEVDNQRQKIIPFFSIETQLRGLSDRLSRAPVDSYCCFHFDQENSQLRDCGLDSLRNPLLSVE